MWIGRCLRNEASDRLTHLTAQLEEVSPQTSLRRLTRSEPIAAWEALSLSECCAVRTDCPSSSGSLRTVSSTEDTDNPRSRSEAVWCFSDARSSQDQTRDREGSRVLNRTCRTDKPSPRNRRNTTSAAHGIEPASVRYADTSRRC